MQSVAGILTNQDIAVPKHTALYKYRVDLDLVSMLWARKHCFGSQTQWMIHCRLDSSPQFARDYLMTEVDIFSPTEVNSWADIGQDGILRTRLMVGQMVGGKGFWCNCEDKKINAFPRISNVDASKIATCLKPVW